MCMLLTSMLTSGIILNHQGWKDPKITSNGTNWHHVSPTMMNQGHKGPHGAFLPEMYNLNLIMKKPSDKCKLRAILQNIWIVLFKMSISKR